MYLSHIYVIRNKKTQEERRVCVTPGRMIVTYKNEYICWQTMYNELMVKYETMMTDAYRRP